MEECGGEDRRREQLSGEVFEMEEYGDGWKEENEGGDGMGGGVEGG